MCIMLYKQAGKPLPKQEYLDNSWSNNPDGAGMAWWLPDESKWQVEKGFMLKEDFDKRYKKLNFKVEDQFVLHWRIGTSGKGKGRHTTQTHPFPIRTRVADMEKLKYKSNRIVFHNGIVGRGSDEYSDTMFAIRDWVDPLLKYINDDKIYILLEELWEPSRVLIMNGTELYQFGTWLTDSQGNEWSDNTFKEDKWVKWVRNQNYNHYSTYSPNYATEDWVSPFRNVVTGEFDWDKWDAAEKTGDSAWEEWKRIEDAETVPPSDFDDGLDTETVVAMIDTEDNIYMDSTYNTKKAMQGFLCCPNCYQDKYLQDSPFNKGDTICLICGSVFMDDSGEQVMWDDDIRKGWLEGKEEERYGTTD